MRLNNKDCEIHFRLSQEQYAAIYSIYEKYHSSTPNLTFSDFMRNLLLSIAYSVDKNNENKKND